MNRSQYNWKPTFEFPVEKEAKICLFDYDNILHTCLYQGKSEETGELNVPYGEKDLEFLFGKVTEMTLKVFNILEDKFGIRNMYCLVGGGNNFRKRLFPPYKANRPPKNPLLRNLYDFTKVSFNTLSSLNAEADDEIFTLSKRIEHTGIIISNDGDLSSIPGIHYDHTKDNWFNVNEKEAKFNQVKKICIGCSSDNVNLSPKIGEAYYNKSFSIDFTDEQYEEALLNSYLKAWKNDLSLAKQNLELAKKLLSLWDTESEEFKNLIKETNG